MNNIVTARERCRWAAGVALITSDPWGHTHRHLLSTEGLIDGRLDSLAVNYIDYLWMSGANKDWSSLHFLGPASWWETYTVMVFLLTLLALDGTETRGWTGEGGWGFVLIEHFDKVILFSESTWSLYGQTQRGLSKTISREFVTILWRGYFVWVCTILLLLNVWVWFAFAPVMLDLGVGLEYCFFLIM